MKKKPRKAQAIPRREALKLTITGAAALPLSGLNSGVAHSSEPSRTATDPDLINPEVTWDLLLTKKELKTTTALCDIIVPEDEHSPSASAVGVPAFINEWISAPYPDQQQDREIVREGLAWLDTESQKRFGTNFEEAEQTQKIEICDDIHHQPSAKAEHVEASQFFDKFRFLTIGGFYTTAAGRKDIAYMGNIPLDEFKGATDKQLAQLGLKRENHS